MRMQGSGIGRRRAGLLAAGLFALLSAAQAAVTDVEAFARIPVQDGGRVMPLDSYARHTLLQFSGRSTYSNAPAALWLARVLFTPDAAADDRIFLVNDASIVEGIVSNSAPRARFSYEQLRPGVEALRAQTEQIIKLEDKDRTPQQKETARLYQNLLSYFALTHAFSFADPDQGISITNAAVRQRMSLPDHQTRFSVYDVFTRAQNLAEDMQAMMTTNAESWTPEQQAVFEVSSLLYQMSQMHRGLPINLLPMAGHEGAGEAWISPWDAIALGRTNEDTARELGEIQALSRAFATGDGAGFAAASERLAASTTARATPSRSLQHVGLEVGLNQTAPFYKAELLYGMAFLLGLLAVTTGARWMRWGTLALVVLALVPHTGGIVCRMVIMGRPPITNLYATFVFVGWACVVLGLVVEALQRNALGSLMAGIAGLVLLLVSGRFADQGDTMGVMMAVLDSNFWLATHVIAINIGYAGCVLAGLAGGVYLILGLLFPPDHPRRVSAARMTYGILAFGLIFSFLGTMLGGVWADQSWGRFWGWDPKENGALLIVIWCTLLFHARICHLIADTGFAAGAALGIIVVLMAWLGVNLLNVGLHSYGFTNTLQMGFYIGVGSVAAFVAATLPFVKRTR